MCSLLTFLVSFPTCILETLLGDGDLRRGDRLLDLDRERDFRATAASLGGGLPLDFFFSTDDLDEELSDLDLLDLLLLLLLDERDEDLELK